MENQATPEQIKAAQEIISNDTPENREKYPELFAKAEELGLLKKETSTGDPVFEEIKSRFGDGYASKEEFFNKVEEWKEQGSVNMETFRSLPAPLFNAIQNHIAGEDWTQAIKGANAVDFSRKYSEDELLNIYMPGKFTQEELDDAENIAVQKAKKQAMQSFELDKQTDANNKLLAKDREKQVAERAKRTLETTIEDFKKKAKSLNPTLPADKLSAWEQRLRAELTSANFQRKFLDGKGGFSEEAASNLFPLVFPNEFTAQWKNMGRMSAEEELQKLINSGGKPNTFERKAPAENKKELTAKALVDTFSQGEKMPYKITPVK